MSGFIVLNPPSRCYVRIRADYPGADPCGVYVRTVDRATVFQSRAAAFRVCESGDVVKPVLDSSFKTETARQEGF